LTTRCSLSIVHSSHQTAAADRCKHQEIEMIKVTFYVYSKILNKEFYNVEVHRSIDDAKLRAMALNWQIHKVEQA
jgi:hypothetical protein